MSPILLLEESKTDTEISWWNTNRQKLNEVIRAFNEWQIKGFSKRGKDIVEAMITRCREYGQKNNFSDWQLEELTKMEEHLKNSMVFDRDERQLEKTTVSIDFFDKLEALGAKWMSESGREELRELIDSARL